MNDDIRVVIENLPTTVRGFVYMDSTFCPCIVLNARMPIEVQRKTFRHEMRHIRNGELMNKEYKENHYDRSRDF